MQAVHSKVNPFQLLDSVLYNQLQRTKTPGEQEKDLQTHHHLHTVSPIISRDQFSEARRQ